CTSNRGVANARDNPPVSPDRSANSRSTANPACDTTPSPSAVTTNPRDQPLPFTWKVLLDLGPIRIFDNPYRPSSGALSAVDTPIKRGQPTTRGEKSGLAGPRPSPTTPVRTPL